MKKVKLAVSNIGWDVSVDQEIYSFMQKNGFEGLEIAPTRIFAESPYDHLQEAKEWSTFLNGKYGLSVPSLQSIWYGQTGNIFVDEDRKKLSSYTKKGIDFASAVGARNLVFGNPKARVIPENMSTDVANEIAKDFFSELADYAVQREISVSLEANPVIYNTNFMNTTREAMNMVKRVNSKGSLLNLDLGAVIYNYHLDEDDADEQGAIELLEEAVLLAHHVHFSEPRLAPLKERELHKKVLQMLENINYPGFVSIEMGNTGNVKDIKQAIEYVAALRKGMF